MLEMEKSNKTEKITNKVGETKRLTRLCKKIFPDNKEHPELGELIFMVRQGLILECTEEEIKAAGHWWLWIRNIFIENTMTEPMKRTIRMIALSASRLGQPVHFVSTRSPELVHAQLKNQGDPNLPRSKKALRELSSLIHGSSRFLPTIGTVLLADVAIDNLETILEVCPDIEMIIKENFKKLEDIANEEKTGLIMFERLSQVSHPSGRKIGEIINLDGSVNIEISFSPLAERKIETASRESLESHQNMFGWTEEQSRLHNRNLAQTMALVGQAVKIINPPAILIHNEAFISRGALNNLLIDQNDPLPVICLTSLLGKRK